MIKVADDLFINVSLEDKPLPLNALVFQYVQLTSNVSFFVPTGKLAIKDTQGFFDSNPVTDGQKISIQIGKTDSKSDVRGYKFRVFKVKTEKGTSSVTYTFYLIHDSPKYLYESTMKSYKGDSYTVLKNIATESELKEVVVDISSDAMVWMQMSDKRCTFARKITQHGYVDNNSCFMLGMRLSGSLHYRNVAKIKADDAIAIFVKGSPIKNTHPVLADKQVANTGLNNSFSGYQYKVQEQGMLTDEQFTKVQVATMSNSLNINQDLNKLLTSGTTVTAPIKSSNLHPNFVKALHQNTRIKNTYANHVHVIIKEATDYDLFDCILYFSVKAVEGKTDADKKISGYFLITAKTIWATGTGIYVEKYQLTRQGENYGGVSAEKVKQLRGDA